MYMTTILLFLKSTHLQKQLYSVFYDPEGYLPRSHIIRVVSYIISLTKLREHNIDWVCVISRHCSYCCCVADRSLPPTYPISPTFFLLSSCTSHTQLMRLLLYVCLIASEAHQKASWWLTAAEGHKSDIVSKIPYPALAFTLSAMKWRCSGAGGQSIQNPTPMYPSTNFILSQWFSLHG